MCGVWREEATLSAPLSLSHTHTHRVHWKVHKKTCRDVAPGELEEIHSMDIQQTFMAIKDRLHGAPDALIAPLIRRLRANFGEEDSDDQHDNIAMNLHTLARGMIFSPGYCSENLWGAPGMTELLLTGTENMLTERVKKRLAAGFPDGLPSVEFAQYELTGEARAAACKLLDSDDEDDEWEGGGQPSYNFCFLYFNLILAAAVHGESSPCSAHDGRGALRPGPLADAAKQRCLELYFDPNVRESVGDAMCPAPSFALTLFASNFEVMSKSRQPNSPMRDKMAALQLSLPPPGTEYGCVQ